MKCCWRCGAPVEEDASYCPYCGQAMQTSAQTSAQMPSQAPLQTPAVQQIAPEFFASENGNSKKRLIAGIAAALVVVIAIGLTAGTAASRSRRRTYYDATYAAQRTQATYATLATTTTTTTTTTAAPTTTTTTRPTTTAELFPTELQSYRSGLKRENRFYKIELKEDDWNINYRSSPQVIEKKKGEPGSNILGVLRSGTVVYVEYIYNGTWAVFQVDNRYVFASVYAANDPSQRTLMHPND